MKGWKGGRVEMQVDFVALGESTMGKALAFKSFGFRGHRFGVKG